MVAQLALQGVALRVRHSHHFVRTALTRSFTNPKSFVVLLAVFQIAVWGCLSAWLAVAPPDDSLEQVLLSQDLRFEYGKHPPLPTWILFAVNRLLGPSVGATFVLGALCSVATMLLLYVFARPLVGAGRAALAAMLLSNVEYMNAGTAYFNHNTVQLPLALLAIALFHRALARTRWRDWALFGLGCGLMMLAKLSAVILFVSFALYLLWTRRLLEASTWRGLAIAAIAAAVVIVPYLAFSVRPDDAAPNAYAMKAVFPDDVDRLQSLKSVWGFASSQFAKVMLALLIFAWLRRGATRVASDPNQPVALGPFLAVIGFGPFVLTVVVAALTGAHLLVGWGATFPILLGLGLVAVPPLAFEATPRVLRRAAWATIAVQLGLWALVTTHGGRLPNLNPTPHPVQPPTPIALADAVKSAWARHCSTPLRHVLTDVHTGSALAVRYGGQPHVVDGNRPEFVKFFPPGAQDADGGVVVLQRPAVFATQPIPMDELITAAEWWSTVVLPLKNGQQGTYFLGVVRPAIGAGCDPRPRGRSDDVAYRAPDPR